MYDIKAIEFGTQHQQHVKRSSHNPTLPHSITVDPPQQQQHQLTKAHSTCSIISSPDSTSSSINSAEATHMTLLSLRRRRIFQRQACLLSILVAFIFGLVLGVFVPMFGLSNIFRTADSSDMQMLPNSASDTLTISANQRQPHPPSDFPTIYKLRQMSTTTDSNSIDSTGSDAFSVAFIKETQRDQELPAEEVFRNAFHLEQDKSTPDSMIVKKLDANDGSIKEFRVHRTQDGLFRKGPERRLSKPTLTEQILRNAKQTDGNEPDYSINFVPLAQRIAENARNQRNHGIIKSDIYWGDLVERELPRGFSAQDASDWNRYVSLKGAVERLEPGCGRMQNRLVIFADGTRACARYRQNTDQIQGELFSFYLGRVLNMSNLAPSAASVIDLESRTWSSAIADITQAQWKQQRPVVLTRWLPDLEPAGIPQPFQPLERHLNKYDVWNITLAAAADAFKPTIVAATAATNTGSDSMATATAVSSNMSAETQKELLKRLGAASSTNQAHQSPTLESAALNLSLSASASYADSSASSSLVLQRLIELAQWSDLIVFDYLIANLDRVVNNLYNYQWNADIMAAPAHNLARQTNSQLLVFLDNESGLLHGYRLLKKYEAYHGLLLDNLCVFRQPTIEALRQLRAYGAGRKLRELFDQTTSAELRDVLPSLPDKSIKILIDRIDRVLGQVQKCRDLLADR